LYLHPDERACGNVHAVIGMRLVPLAHAPKTVRAVFAAVGASIGNELTDDFLGANSAFLLFVHFAPSVFALHTAHTKREPL